MAHSITPSVELVNEDSLILRFSLAQNRPAPTNTTQSDILLLDTIRAWQRYLLHTYADAIVDCIPAYASLSITLKFPAYTPQEFADMIKDRLINEGVNRDLSEYVDNSRPKTVCIPCCYDVKLGTDLEQVAEYLNLSVNAIIGMHCQTEFIVRAIGFSPGFPYLSSLPDSLRIPRKAIPVKRVQPGSVAIAEDQCGIYPQATPGGWHIIGETPMNFLNQYAANTSDISPLSVGDRVNFERIDYKTFLELKKISNL